jgi:hypothetical protein
LELSLFGSCESNIEQCIRSACFWKFNNGDEPLRCFGSDQEHLNGSFLQLQHRGTLSNKVSHSLILKYKGFFLELEFDRSPTVERSFPLLQLTRMLDRSNLFETFKESISALLVVE